MTTRKISNLRWHIAALLFAATVINYVDRQTLSVLAPVLAEELQISDIEYSNILQAFLVSYTVMYVVSGVVVDRWGTRLSLAVAMVWWSLAGALHATGRTPLALGVYRFLLGIGESVNFLAAEKAISEWYPPKERGLANGLVNAAASVGAIISPPLIVWLNIRYGWRPAFILTGAAGFVWLAGWLFLYHVPEKHPRITAEEWNHITGSPAGSGHSRQRIPWLQLLKFKQTWGLLLARVFADPVWWFYLFWLPKYLKDQRGFSMVEIGVISWLPYLTADIGSVVGGAFSGRLVKRNVPAVKARKAAMLPCVLLMPLGMMIAFTPSSAVALSLICLVTFSHMAWKTNLMTLTNDIYPTRVVGSVAGIVGVGSGLGGALFTNLTGRLVQDFSYNMVFIIMAFLHPVAMLIVYLLVQRPIATETEVETTHATVHAHSS